MSSSWIWFANASIPLEVCWISQPLCNSLTLARSFLFSLSAEYVARISWRVSWRWPLLEIILKPRRFRLNPYPRHRAHISNILTFDGPSDPSDRGILKKSAVSPRTLSLRPFNKSRPSESLRPRVTIEETPSRRTLSLSFTSGVSQDPLTLSLAPEFQLNIQTLEHETNG